MYYKTESISSDKKKIFMVIKVSNGQEDITNLNILFCSLNFMRQKLTKIQGKIENNVEYFTNNNHILSYKARTKNNMNHNVKILKMSKPNLVKNKNNIPIRKELSQ